MRIHIIGSEGVSMKWIAEYFRSKGAEVSGSDIQTGGHNADNVNDAELVIYTSAIDESNPELVRAKELSIPTISRSEALGQIAQRFETLIAIAGTHGKTTVTAMLSEIFKGYDAATHLGGTIDGKLGEVSGKVLISEACEYQRNFLTLLPDIAVILNMELDHTDCYNDISDVTNAFSRFASQSKKVIIPEEQSGILLPHFGGKQILVGNKHGHYGLKEWAAESADRLGSEVTIETPEGDLHIKLNVIGKHNAQNAVFATAAAMEYGVKPSDIVAGLERFKGVDRRLELKGSVNGVPLYSDYAHHASEIRAGIAALRSVGYKEPLVVFQPHTYERLRTMEKDIAIALLGARSIILPVFKARGKTNEKSSGHLAQEIMKRYGASIAVDSYDMAAKFIRGATNLSDVIIVMGAGDNENLLPLILD